MQVLQTEVEETLQHMLDCLVEAGRNYEMEKSEVMSISRREIPLRSIVESQIIENDSEN